MKKNLLQFKIAVLLIGMILVANVNGQDVISTQNGPNIDAVTVTSFNNSIKEIKIAQKMSKLGYLMKSPLALYNASLIFNKYPTTHNSSSQIDNPRKLLSNAKLFAQADAQKNKIIISLIDKEINRQKQLALEKQNLPTVNKDGSTNINNFSYIRISMEPNGIDEVYKTYKMGGDAQFWIMTDEINITNIQDLVSVNVYKGEDFKDALSYEEIDADNNNNAECMSFGIKWNPEKDAEYTVVVTNKTEKNVSCIFLSN